MKRTIQILISILVVVSLVACESGSSGGDGGSDGGSDTGNDSIGDNGSNDTGSDSNGEGDCEDDFAGCSTYMDYTAEDEVTVVFATVGDHGTYTPKCIRILAGTTVIFSGDGVGFETHPLRQACGPVDDLIFEDFFSDKEITFDVEGIYGYFCLSHGDASGTGMAGSIEVVAD